MGEALMGRNVTFDFGGVIAATRSGDINLVNETIEQTTRDDDGKVKRLFLSEDINVDVSGLVTDSARASVLALSGTKNESTILIKDNDGLDETNITATLLCSNLSVTAAYDGLVEFSLTLEGSGGYAIG